MMLRPEMLAVRLGVVSGTNSGSSFWGCSSVLNVGLKLGPETYVFGMKFKEGPAPELACFFCSCLKVNSIL